jgi:hypothetical protein
MVSSFTRTQLPIARCFSSSELFAIGKPDSEHLYTSSLQSFRVFTGVWWRIGGVFTGVWWRIGGVFTGVWRRIGGVFTGVWRRIGGVFTGVWWRIGGVFTGVWRCIGGVFTTGSRLGLP